MSENAQQRGSEPGGGSPARHETGVEPDVLLDIPEVSVDSIRLAGDGLDADLSLRARMANLLEIDAGVRVHLEGVELDISGVHAEALLKVRLENVVAILERAMTTIDLNPQIIEDLARAVAVPRGQRVAGDGGQLSAVARRAGGRRNEFTAPREPEAGDATDDLGQQVGAIGAVADQAVRETRGGVRAAGAAAGGPGAGAAAGERGGPPARGPGLASGSGGGGERGEAFRARERQAAAAGVGRAGTAGEQERPPEAAGAERGGAGGQPPEESDRATTGPGGGTSGAVHLAEQAGETLRQAGRSVWEAIQGGMARRQQGN